MPTGAYNYGVCILNDFQSMGKAFALIMWILQDLGLFWRDNSKIPETV